VTVLGMKGALLLRDWGHGSEHRTIHPHTTSKLYPISFFLNLVPRAPYPRPPQKACLRVCGVLSQELASPPSPRQPSSSIIIIIIIIIIFFFFFFFFIITFSFNIADQRDPFSPAIALSQSSPTSVVASSSFIHPFIHSSIHPPIHPSINPVYPKPFQLLVATHTSSNFSSKL